MLLGFLKTHMNLHRSGKQAACRPSSSYMLPHGGVSQLTADRKTVGGCSEDTEINRKHSQ